MWDAKNETFPLCQTQQDQPAVFTSTHESRPQHWKYAQRNILIQQRLRLALAGTQNAFNFQPNLIKTCFLFGLNGAKPHFPCVSRICSGTGLNCCLMFLLGHTVANSSAGLLNPLLQFSWCVANESGKFTQADF